MKTTTESASVTRRRTASKPKRAVKSASTPEQTPAPAQQEKKLEVVMTLTHDQIARRAYDIWVAKGRPVGQDDENWKQAVRELSAMSGS